MINKNKGTLSSSGLLFKLIQVVDWDHYQMMIPRVSINTLKEEYQHHLKKSIDRELDNLFYKKKIKCMKYKIK